MRRRRRWLLSTPTAKPFYMQSLNIVLCQWVGSADKEREREKKNWLELCIPVRFSCIDTDTKLHNRMEKLLRNLIVSIPRSFFLCLAHVSRSETRNIRVSAFRAEFEFRQAENVHIADFHVNPNSYSAWRN